MQQENLFKIKKEYNDLIYKKTKEYQKIYNFDIGTGRHDTWNNEADAFKHAFMSADLSLKYTNIGSLILGNYHEIETNNNPKNEKNMDKWNNAQGREIAKELVKEYGNKLKNFSEQQKDDLIAKKVMQRMKSGKLITTPNDKRTYTGFAADIPEGKIFTAEEIGKLSTNDFSNYEKYINNQLETYGVPRDYQAQQDVINGVLIWVDKYTRSDGTEVSGYYRHK